MSPSSSKRFVSTASPLHFTLSRGSGRSIVVTEMEGRAGGSFTDMSSALRFVETQCAACGCPIATRFDPSLAMIRAACA